MAQTSPTCRGKFKVVAPPSTPPDREAVGSALVSASSPRVRRMGRVGSLHASVSQYRSRRLVAQHPNSSRRWGLRQQSSSSRDHTRTHWPRQCNINALPSYGRKIRTTPMAATSFWRAHVMDFHMSIDISTALGGIGQPTSIQNNNQLAAKRRGVIGDG